MIINELLEIIDYKVDTSDEWETDNEYTTVEEMCKRARAILDEILIESPHTGTLFFKCPNCSIEHLYREVQEAEKFSCTCGLELHYTHKTLIDVLRKEHAKLKKIL